MLGTLEMVGRLNCEWCKGVVAPFDASTRESPSSDVKEKVSTCTNASCCARGRGVLFLFILLLLLLLAFELASESWSAFVRTGNE